jgi:hypothetical protein
MPCPQPVAGAAGYCRQPPGNVWTPAPPPNSQTASGGKQTRRFRAPQHSEASTQTPPPQSALVSRCGASQLANSALTQAPSPSVELTQKQPVAQIDPRQSELPGHSSRQAPVSKSQIVPAGQQVISSGPKHGSVPFGQQKPSPSMQNVPAGQQTNRAGPSGPSSMQTRSMSPAHSRQALLQAAVCGPGRPAQATVQADCAASPSVLRAVAVPAATPPPARSRTIQRR